MEPTHFNESGRARMVDVGEKQDTVRTAVASGQVKMHPETARMIREGSMKKGDVLAVAQVAGIMGAKRTQDVVPMCHNILLTGCDISFEIRDDSVYMQATVRSSGKTGVEMEALTAVSVAGLTIYDMCKAVDKAMEITDIRLESKTGGKSGDYRREQD